MLRQAASDAEALEQAQRDLAQCYRLTGADPDGNEAWRLAPLAVQEVTRLRDECDAAEVSARDMQARLQRVVDGSVEMQRKVKELREVLELVSEDFIYRHQEGCEKDDTCRCPHGKVLHERIDGCLGLSSPEIPS